MEHASAGAPAGARARQSALARDDAANSATGAKERFQRWRDLPPENRRELRDKWQEFRTLPPDQQAEVRDNFRKFKQLTPEQRQRLRERWQNATPEQRQRLLERARERQQMRQQRQAPAERRIRAPDQRFGVSAYRDRYVAELDAPHFVFEPVLSARAAGLERAPANAAVSVRKISSGVRSDSGTSAATRIERSGTRCSGFS